MNEHWTGGKEKFGIAYPDMLKRVENLAISSLKQSQHEMRRRNSTGIRPDEDTLAMCLSNEEAL